MWFGAVWQDCAVFLGPKGAVFAFFRWQEGCFYRIAWAALTSAPASSAVPMVMRR